MYTQQRTNISHKDRGEYMLWLASHVTSVAKLYEPHSEYT